MPKDELISLTIVSFIALLITGFGSYAILFKPKLGNRLINMSKTRLAPWTMKEGSEVYIMIMTLVTFLAFLCVNCFVLYSWMARFLQN